MGHRTKNASHVLDIVNGQDYDNVSSRIPGPRVSCTFHIASTIRCSRLLRIWETSTIEELNLAYSTGLSKSIKRD